MSYGPEYAGIPQQTAFVRTVRSKVIQLIDEITHCNNDEAALNGWRQLCAYGIAIVMDLEQQGKIPTKKDDGEDWRALVNRLKKDWNELKTSEKTQIEIGREGNFEYYLVQWDSYVGKFARADLNQGVAIMDREKYNAICHRLMQFWGLCESILFASGALSLSDKVEVPLPMDSYGADQLFEGVSSRKVLKRQDSQKQPR